jgi:TatD DNase family protein
VSAANPVSSVSDRRGTPPPAPEPLPAPVVDAHTHLDACGVRDKADLQQAMDRAAAVGVTRVVTVADDLDSARWAAEAATWHPGVVAAVALHPTRTSTFDQETRDTLEELAGHERVRAIGETGLDHYWDYSPHEEQESAFRWHIDLAKRLRKPLMIHDRDAHADVLRVLHEEGAPETVVFHCFSGDADMARTCADAGYLLSFAGPLTFRNGGALREAAAVVPLGQLLVETDAPYLTPDPYRGRPNEPYLVPHTVRRLAEVKGVEEAELCAAVDATAERVFGPW